MSDNKYISWTSFCQAMNSIAYWLLQNKKKYKKRDHYQILTLKGSCSDIEKKAKKLGNDKLVSMYTMALIKDNTSLDFLKKKNTKKSSTKEKVEEPDPDIEHPEPEDTPEVDDLNALLQDEDNKDFDASDFTL